VVEQNDPYGVPTDPCPDGLRKCRTTDISPTAAELVQRRNLNSWPPGSIRLGLPGETCTNESAGQARITPLSAADCSLATFEHCIYLVSPVGGTFQQLEDTGWSGVRVGGPTTRILRLGLNSKSEWSWASS
jgi:hypothetical protein